MAEPVQVVLDRLQGARRSGTGWMARCPVHEDRNASLSVAAGDDGRALLTCHAGCATETVITAVGLDMADLFPRTNGAAGPARPAPAQGNGRQTRYRVRMADGSHGGELIEHIRLDLPDDTKRFWWERNGHKGLGGVSPSAFALYLIDDLRASGADRVVLVEGEKAADALAAFGVPAVGTVTGAATIPCRDALLALADLDVILWRDADGAGLGHMQKIAKPDLPQLAATYAAAERLVDRCLRHDESLFTPGRLRRLLQSASSPHRARRPLTLGRCQQRPRVTTASPRYLQRRAGSCHRGP